MREELSVQLTALQGVMEHDRVEMMTVAGHIPAVLTEARVKLAAFLGGEGGEHVSSRSASFALVRICK